MITWNSKDGRAIRMSVLMEVDRKTSKRKIPIIDLLPRAKLQTLLKQQSSGYPKGEGVSSLHLKPSNDRLMPIWPLKILASRLEVGWRIFRRGIGSIRAMKRAVNSIKWIKGKGGRHCLVVTLDTKNALSSIWFAALRQLLKASKWSTQFRIQPSREKTYWVLVIDSRDRIVSNSKDTLGMVANRSGRVAQDVDWQISYWNIGSDLVEQRKLSQLQEYKQVAQGSEFKITVVKL